MKYIVSGGIALIGIDMVLTLTADQASARMRNLAPVLNEQGGEVKGVYRPKTIVQFKAGETIGLDVDWADLPRPLQIVLTPVGGLKPRRTKKTPVTSARVSNESKPNKRSRKPAEKPADAGDEADPGEQSEDEEAGNAEAESGDS
tara:strand:- start:114 stop:548 length:435 start_codon:yes stop_codon:yes gene_type:complete